MQEWQVPSLGQEDLLEEGKATPSSILAWRIPWTEEPGKLQSLGSHRVRDDWSNLACLHARRGRPRYSLSTVRGHSLKAAICKPGRRPSLETKPVGTLILTFPVSGTLEKCVLIKPLGLWYFCYSSLSWLTQPLNSILVENEPELLEGCLLGQGREKTRWAWNILYHQLCEV